MSTGIKLAMILILSVGMLTALTMLTSNSGLTPAFAKKKHCDKLNTGCDSITSSNRQYLLRGNESSTSRQTDLGQNDSNIVDEPTTLEDSQTQIDNSNSSKTTKSGDPFQLPDI
jgi:hypothetical protein